MVLVSPSVLAPRRLVLWVEIEGNIYVPLCWATLENVSPCIYVDNFPFCLENSVMLWPALLFCEVIDVHLPPRVITFHYLCIVLDLENIQ